MGAVKAQAAIMVMPQEVARDGFAGWVEIYATLYPENITSLSAL
jgi:hypothetical protein